MKTKSLTKMEILMKLKCSPAASTRSPHSTLKVVDHHHQLQQQHIVGHPAHMQSPLMPSSSSASLQEANMSLPPPPPPQAPPSSSQELMLPTCLEYATTMDCCGAAQQEIVDLQWDHTPSGGGVHRNRNNIPLPGREPICPDFMHSMFAASHTPHANASHSPLNLACCAAYEPPCCSAIPFRATGPMMPPTPLQHHVRLPQCPTPMTIPLINADDYNNSFAYHEPDENFISIDDVKIKGFLMKIGEKEKQRREQQLKAENLAKSQEPVVYEIIELDDEEPLESVVPKPATSPKPLKGRNPSQVEGRKEKIVARIDLLDSSSESEPDADEEELPLAAAAAVSCELQCDVDERVEEERKSGRKSVEADVVVLNSDDEEENVDFIDELEEGVELHWDDLEENRERTFFECFLCGKKVQSSYNLRRHMMIHTGERPFGCDMCERRFREFSDLKKHRRRHVHEPNFVCMICRINTPTDHDPTRCLGCDSKNAAALAAMRPQVSSSPEKSQTPPVVLRSTKQSASKPPSRNQTPAPTPQPAKSTSPPSLPPLTPIGSLTTHSSSTSDTQLMLDNVPVVHRPSFNQQGVLTRKEFPCPLCQRPFGTRHNLKRHFMIHTGEKPFNCPKCRKPFREYSTLKKHQTTHKRDRWYKCHFCAYKSRDYLNYMDHKSSHPKSEASNSRTKKKPKLTHTSQDDSYDSNEDDSSTEDWLECCECGQRFTDIEVYTEHLKEHDPTVFLYECYICKQTFAERELLVKHLAEHDDNDVGGQVETTTVPSRGNSTRKIGKRTEQEFSKQNEE